MFTAPFLDKIVAQTNLYAKQIMEEEKYNKWEKITRDELRAYIGFCILMGIANLPALDDYWSTDPVLRYPAIAERISRDRFREYLAISTLWITLAFHLGDHQGTIGWERCVL